MRKQTSEELPPGVDPDVERGPEIGEAEAAAPANEPAGGSVGTADEPPADPASPAGPLSDSTGADDRDEDSIDPDDPDDADEDATGEDDPDEDDEADGARSRRFQWGRGDWLVAILASMLGIAVVSVALLAYQAYQARELETSRSQAVAAAERAAADILSYDYRHLQKDFDTASKHLTGRFAKEYQTTTRQGVERLAGEVHAVVTADVRGASVVSASTEEVVVLLFVNQTTKSDVRKNEQLPDQNRVRMTMKRVGDRWLVSKLEAL